MQPVLIKRMDHVMILCDHEKHLYDLFDMFHKVLKLPVAWYPVLFPESTVYRKPHLSASVFIGNVFLDLYHFPNLGKFRRMLYRRPARFCGVSYEPIMSEEAMKSLKFRDLIYTDTMKYLVPSNAFMKNNSDKLKHFRAPDSFEDLMLYESQFFEVIPYRPFKVSRHPFKRYTYLDVIASLSQQEGFLISLKSYNPKYIDIEDVRKTLSSELEENQTDAFGLCALDRVVFSSQNSLSFTTFFDNLYSPVDPISLTEWQIKDSPLIRLEENQTEGISQIMLKTKSFVLAREALEEKRLIQRVDPDHITLKPTHFSGLRISIKE